MERQDLIKSLRKQGFSEQIVRSFESVDRSEFVPEGFKAESYKDVALPIGGGQTISQPYTIAFMLSLLEIAGKKSQKILEVGSGSGYVLALINEITKDSEIIGIERIKELVDRSKRVLIKNNNIKIIHDDGSKGLAEEAEKEKFDRILVSAACKDIPQKLLKQLKIRGVLVASVGNSIVSVKKFPDENKIREFPGFVFVPMVE